MYGNIIPRLFPFDKSQAQETKHRDKSHFEEKEKTPEPKTEQERLDEKVLELLHQHSLDAQSAIIDLLARMAVKPEEK